MKATIKNVTLSILMILPLNLIAASTITESAAGWLATLDENQLEDVLYEFDDFERFDIRLAPVKLEGLRRDKMSSEQWLGLLSVFNTVLSKQGLETVENVMSLEYEVNQLRAQRSFWYRWFEQHFHNNQAYYLAIFGYPIAGQPWGLRFDGHHLSLNWTVSANGQVSTEPMFVGSEPREVPAEWQRKGLRILANEEDAGLTLWQSLDNKQLERSELVFAPEHDGKRPMFLGSGRIVNNSLPIGLSRGDMNPQQQQFLDNIVETYLSRLNPQQQQKHYQAIAQTGVNSLHFAWGGSLLPGETGYYRISGPTILIEFDNTTETADHIHTIVRDLQGDFGTDILAEHYQHLHPDQVDSELISKSINHE